MASARRWPPDWKALTRAVQGALSGVLHGNHIAPPVKKPGLGATRDQTQLETQLRASGVKYLHAIEYEPARLPEAIQEMVRYDGSSAGYLYVPDRARSESYVNKMGRRLLQDWIREALSGPRPAVSIGTSVAGRGLFAAEELPAGTLVGLYAGEVCSLSQRDSTTEDYLFSPPGFARGNSFRRAEADFAIDASRKGNETRFINHSARPNLDVVFIKRNDLWTPGFVANRDIASGEELTFDYETRNYWAGRRGPAVDL